MKVFYISSLAVLFVFFAFDHKIASAQTAPQIIATWEANNFAPVGYEGRTLPVRGTTITVSLEIIENGIFTNLGTSAISWLVNNELYKSGKGLKTFSYTIPSTASGNYKITAVLPSYKGKRLEKSLIIPITTPSVAIRPSSGTKSVPAASEVSFTAIPFFFNTKQLSDISFLWSANGVATEGAVENPEKLILDLSSGTSGNEFSLSVQAMHSKKTSELGNQIMTLRIQ
jgi:hypothetical protein